MLAALGKECTVCHAPLAPLSNPVFCACPVVLGCGAGPGLLLDQGLQERVGQACSQGKDFNVFFCFYDTSSRRVMLCLLMQLQLFPHLCIHQQLLDDRAG